MKKGTAWLRRKMWKNSNLFQKEEKDNTAETLGWGWCMLYKRIFGVVLKI